MAGTSIVQVTANRGYDLPVLTNGTKFDIPRMRAALNAIDTDISEAFAAIALLAPINNPAFTGAPTAPTRTSGDNSNALATTAFVQAAVSSADFSNYAPKNNPVFTGFPQMPTPASSENSTVIATTAYVRGWVDIIRGGVVGAYDTLAELAAAVTAKADAAATTTALATKASLTGAENLTNKTLTTPTIILKQSAAPAPTTEGEVWWDTDDDTFVVGTGSSQKVFRSNKWELIARIQPSSAAQIVQTGLSGFRHLRISGHVAPTVATQILLQLSTDNGSSFITNADHPAYFFGQGSGAGSVGTNSIWAGLLIAAFPANIGLTAYFDHTLTRFNETQKKYLVGESSGYSGGDPAHFRATCHSSIAAGSVACNALRILPASGLISSGEIFIEGVRT